MIWSVIVVNLFLGLLGLGILLHARAGMIHAWPAALFVGITSWTTLTLLLSYAGVRLPVWVVLLIAPAVVGLSPRFRVAAVSAWIDRRRVFARVRVALTRPGVLVTTTLALAAVTLALLMLRAAPNRPIREWDSWSFWIPKAEALASPQGIDSPVLRAPEYAHLDYPLFVPTLWSNAWGLIDGWSTSATQVQMAMLLIAFFGVAFTCLRALAPSWAAAAGALALFGIRPLGETVLSLYADVPMAIAACVLVLATIGWAWRHEAPYLLIASLAAAMLTTSKSEGMLMWACVLVSFLGLLIAMRGRRWLPWLGAMLMGVVPWILWRLVILGTPVEADYDFARLLSPGDLGARSDRAATAASALWRVPLEPQLIGLLLVGCLGVAVALLAGEWRVPLATMVFLALSWVGLTVVYTISDLPLANYLATSASRVLIAPLLVWAAAGVAVALIGGSRLGLLGRAAMPEVSSRAPEAA